MSRICRERVVTFWCTGQKNYGKLLRYMTPYDKDCDQGSHVLGRKCRQEVRSALLATGVLISPSDRWWWQAGHMNAFVCVACELRGQVSETGFEFKRFISPGHSGLHERPSLSPPRRAALFSPCWKQPQEHSLGQATRSLWLAVLPQCSGALVCPGCQP